MNKVILMGRLTRDPELRYSQSANPVAVTNYSLAVRRQYQSEGQPDVDFINIVAFGKSGEFAEKYFQKGQMVAVSGRLQIGSWEDDKGTKRLNVDVVAEEQHFAESKASFERRNPGSNDQSNKPAEKPAKSTPSKSKDDGFMPIDERMAEDEDLPF